MAFGPAAATTTTTATGTVVDLGDCTYLPSPRSDAHSKKRKCGDSQEEPSRKKTRQSPSDTVDGGNLCEYGSEVRWSDYYHGAWPPMDTETDVSRGRSGGSKRPHSASRTSSYSQRVRDGDSPQPWTRRHEERMLEAGLVMNEYQTEAATTDECREMCAQVARAKFSPPTGPSFEKDRLLKTLDLVRFRNEARIARDITPLVVPLPELLHVDGCPGLEHICEAMNAEWTQIATICGPRPKPDLVAGIAPAAFTSEEREKLRVNHTSVCPSLFPENMYYPFLLCEVKGSDRPIQEAE